MKRSRKTFEQVFFNVFSTFRGDSSSKRGVFRQEAAATGSADAYKMFATWQNKITEQTEIRGQLDFREEDEM